LGAGCPLGKELYGEVVEVIDKDICFSASESVMQEIAAIRTRPRR